MIPYTPALRDRLAGNLALHTRHEYALDGRRHAAVAIAIVDSNAERDGHDPFPVASDYFSDVQSDVSGLDGRMSGVAGGAAFLLCRRAPKLSAHAGQWALPGGRCEGDETASEAALRELHEELGLLLREDSVLGLLDDYVTRSGYVITPVVVWGGGDVDLVPDPAEVAHAYRIGLHELCRADSPRFATIAESDRPVVEVPLGGDLIYAPTAAMLVQFRWVAVEGRVDERVNGFEQPVFAWR
jgi:8-oxo-dGTP pyrophosphatase MutT (NUDIX family)